MRFSIKFITNELLLLVEELEKSQDSEKFMVEAGGEKERVSPKFNCKMEEFELQRYTGMKPQALAGWNIKSNGSWIRL